MKNYFFLTCCNSNSILQIRTTYSSVRKQVFPWLSSKIPKVESWEREVEESELLIHISHPIKLICLAQNSDIA